MMSHDQNLFAKFAFNYRKATNKSKIDKEDLLQITVNFSSSRRHTTRNGDKCRK